MSETLRDSDPVHIPTWTLGDRLRKARVDADMTQDELAAVIGCKPSTIAAWETNRHAPSLQNVELIADNCRVALWWVLGYDHDPGRRAILERKVITTWFRQLDLGFLNFGKIAQVA
jgi:transcriptional regulator with XRE-family HTH domain